MSGDDKRHTTKSIKEFFGFKKNTSSRRDQKVVKKLKPNESALRTCPLCAKDFHWTLINAHASECLDGGGGRCSSEKKKKKEESVREEDEEEESKADAAREEEEEENKTTATTTTIKNDAFATLIQNQRLSECKKSLVLSFEKGLGTWNVAFEKKCSGVDASSSSPSPSPSSSPLSSFTGATVLKEIERGGIKCKTTLTVSLGNSARDVDSNNSNSATNDEICASYTNHRLSQSVLASALQKNVRRKRVGPTYRVAKAMSRRNDTFMQCVRRLMIISIEDGTLHPDLPFLAWLMIALSKNFVASTRIKEEVCRIASELAAQEFRDDGTHSNEGEDDEKEDDRDDVDVDILPSLSSIQEKFGSNSEETLLLASLIIRAQFGGMEGDVKMLKNFIRVWARRFESDSLLWLDKIKSNSPRMDVTRLKEMSAHPFVKFDIPLEAIDFHVSDIIEHCVPDISSEEFQNIRKVASGFSSYGKEEEEENVDAIDLFKARELAKSAMWYCSSGFNEKTLWHPRMDEDESTRKRKRLEPVFKSYAKKACAFAIRAIGERFELYKQ